MTTTPTLDEAFQHLAAFRDRYGDHDDSSLIDGASGLTVADLDVLLVRLYQTKDLRQIPTIDLKDAPAVVKRPGR